MSITSTRTACNRGTARPSSWASQAGIEEVEPGAGDQALPLVCRPGLELRTGVAGLCRERHGNLRSDGGQAVFSRALAQGGRSIDGVWFGLDRLPAVGGLAARYGGRAEQELPFTEAVATGSVRWPPQGAAASNARTQAGPQGKDDHRRTRLRPGPLARPL